MGREVDTSVKGRGIALGDDGRPTAVQIRTPEQAPAETPPFSPMTWYSRELPNFLDNASRGD